MKTVFAASAALAAVLFAGSPASAEITVDSARAILAPFYKALNAEFVKNAPELVRQTTTPDWKTCRGNDACNSRDEVMVGIGQRLKAIPDLKWENQGSAGCGKSRDRPRRSDGHAIGRTVGNATNGKSFKLMSIDMHTLEGDKIARTYHVEDWQGAFRQMSAAK
jgi:hypothetical protein